MKNCVFCNKEISDHLNYCSWECQIDEAKKNNGKVICPNGLPISCIKYDWSLMEHPDADHPNYKFPVEAEFIGEKRDLPGWDTSYTNENHALIYSDSSVALTIYECNFAIWSVHDGKIMGGRYWDQNEWKLSDEALDRIRKLNVL